MHLLDTRGETLNDFLGSLNDLDYMRINNPARIPYPLFNFSLN